MSSILGPAVNCPRGPGLRGTAPEVSNGIRCRCGEEEKGREGAAAQPPGLFCVGRLPLPVFAASAAEAASGCRRGGMPIDAARWAWEGCFGYCSLPVPSQGVTSQPLPRPITVTVVPEELWD